MMPKKENAISVKNLHKSFRLPHEQHSGIKQKIINIFKGVKGYEEQHVLKGVTFGIKKGEFFGIVGRNGSGKSTLLKLLAGIYTADSGSIDVNGSLIPFIELGVGFNQELTGRENIFLNGALLGFSRREMEEKYDSIVEFSELERFIDQKLKNYSSGMQVRLAFSIAIRAQGDIILLDEVLAVGDEAFQRKCFEYFAKLKKEKKTVILVTHDMSSVARFCNKAMLIDKGEIVAIGDINKVVRGYEKLNRTSDSADESTTKKEKYDVSRGTIVANLNSSEKNLVEVESDSALNFTININPKEDMEEVFMGFTIQKSSGEYVYWYTTEDSRNIIDSLKAGVQKRIHLSMQNIFGNGEYSVNINVKKNDRTKDYIVVHDAVKFEVKGWNHLHGWMYHPEVSVEVI